MQKEKKEIVVLEEKGCIEPGCPNMVVFTNIDEDYYRANGYIKPNGEISRPKRCKPCRTRRKASGKTPAELAKEAADEKKKRQANSPFAPALEQIREKKDGYKEVSDKELIGE